MYRILRKPLVPAFFSEFFNKALYQRFVSITSCIHWNFGKFQGCLSVTFPKELFHIIYHFCWYYHFSSCWKKAQYINKASAGTKLHLSIRIRKIVLVISKGRFSAQQWSFILKISLVKVNKISEFMISLVKVDNMRKNLLNDRMILD